MASNHSYKNKLGVQQPIVIKKKLSANTFDAKLCQTFYNLELQFPWEVTKHIIGDELVYRQISPGNFRTTSLHFLSTVQNYTDKIMQIFTMRYNLEFRKLTLITRPQSIKKSKQISGQTILSSPQDLELNPNFAKNRLIIVIKNALHGLSRQRC